MKSGRRRICEILRGVYPEWTEILRPDLPGLRMTDSEGLRMTGERY